MLQGLATWALYGPVNGANLDRLIGYGRMQAVAAAQLGFRSLGLLALAVRASPYTFPLPQDLLTFSSLTLVNSFFVLLLTLFSRS